jgi:hypothetical protein
MAIIYLPSDSAFIQTYVSELVLVKRTQSPTLASTLDMRGAWKGGKWTRGLLRIRLLQPVGPIELISDAT